MSKKNYYCEYNPKKEAMAMASNQPASLKFSVEILREIKGKKVERAQKFLENVISHKEHLPLAQYKIGVAHRKGDPKSNTKSGRYPEKTCKVFLDLLTLAKANADYKGINAENLIIKNGFASQGYQRISYQSQGRISGKRRQRKSVHLELVVMEGK